MNVNGRRKHIIDKLHLYGAVNVNELQNELLVSLPTIRSDLNELERSGVIIRTFGGAILNEQKQNQNQNQDYNHKVAELSYSARIPRNQESKTKIGKIAVELISNYDSVFLDAGTTVFHLLEEIVQRNIMQLVILTNSIYMCTYLTDYPHVGHILMGGSVKPVSMATIGFKTIEEIKRNKVNKVFLGADGLSEDGFTVQDINEAMTKLAMIDIAVEKYLLVDSSKINNPTFAEVAKYDVLDAIITEKGMIYIKKGETDFSSLFAEQQADCEIL